VKSPSTRAALLAIALVLADYGVARAHLLAPYLLELRELDGGRAAALWKVPVLQPAGVDVHPLLPPRCRPQGPPQASRNADSASYRWTVDCGGGLIGTRISATGLSQSKGNVLVRIVLADGRLVRGLLDERHAELTIPPGERPIAVLTGYLSLGIEHLSTGLDHLLFVLGLVLLVRGRRRLLGTITSFTLGHSVTLSMAALGLVALPPAPIELAIALTILVLAVELTRLDSGAPSFLRRRPSLMAFTFGLLHGLGFAGALGQIGLPSSEIPLALFGFNAGIEIAQIVFVVIVLAVLAAAKRIGWRAVERGALVPAYAIGALAVLWCYERIAVLF